MHSIAMYKKYFLRNYASNKMHLKIPFPLNFPYSTSSSTKLKTQKLWIESNVDEWSRVRNKGNKLINYKGKEIENEREWWKLRRLRKC